TPFGNTLSLDMAKAAIEHENLGNNGEVDFLALSLSTTDYIGHQFGPNAIEVEDMYLRLDKDLGEFFNYLDSKVGKGEYLVFLTADHGGAHNLNFMEDNRIPAGAFNTGRVLTDLNKALESEFMAED